MHRVWAKMSYQNNTSDNRGISESSKNSSSRVDHDGRQKRIAEARTFMLKLQNLAKKPVFRVTLTKPRVEPAVTLNVDSFRETFDSSTSSTVLDHFNLTLLDSFDDVYLFQSRLKEILKDNYDNYNQLLLDWFSSKIENYGEFSRKVRQYLADDAVQMHNQYIRAIISRVHSEQTSMQENFATFVDKIILHPLPKSLSSSDSSESLLFKDDELDEEEEELIIRKPKRKVKPISDDEEEKEVMKEEDDDLILPVRRKRKVRCIESDDEGAEVESNLQPNLSNFIAKEAKLEAESSGSLKTKIKIGRASDGAQTYAILNDSSAKPSASNYQHVQTYSNDHSIPSQNNDQVVFNNGSTSMESDLGLESEEKYDVNRVNEFQALCDNNSELNISVNSFDTSYITEHGMLIECSNESTVTDVTFCDANHVEDDPNLQLSTGKISTQMGKNFQDLQNVKEKNHFVLLIDENNGDTFLLPEGQFFSDKSNCKVTVDDKLIAKLAKTSKNCLCLTNGKEIIDFLFKHSDQLLKTCKTQKQLAIFKKILDYTALKNGIFIDSNVRLRVETIAKNDLETNGDVQLEVDKESSLHENIAKENLITIPSFSEIALENLLSVKSAKLYSLYHNIVNIAQLSEIASVEEVVADLCKIALENFIRNLLTSMVNLKYQRNFPKIDRTSFFNRDISNLSKSNSHLFCLTKSSSNLPECSGFTHEPADFEENAIMGSEKKLHLHHLFHALKHDNSLIPLHQLWYKALYRIISALNVTRS